MIHIHKESDTAVIVVHEIYGINQHMKSICNLLADRGIDIICPNLLGREIPFPYSEEALAYQYFIEKVGFTKAAAIVKDVLLETKEKYKKVFVLGFSVGATVAWLCSTEKLADGIVGYYGSRIRDYLDMAPQCPVLLFFPQEEPSFDVGPLLLKLHKKNVTTHKFTGKHGFSDPFSQNYHVESAQAAFHELLKFIE
ncbi:DeoR faimly transcriptional regulator [Bacillus sp. FJAT-27231]|uniref:dienelactone hydrolase family protein n=1 Tax=Bacillus sp. FJAT-27231 TaxID=1679168 RepID=UPI000670823A|nr:dienelactone hydrolase family protein [Bacillus sp. FJAT-27231]KMY54170.1 DeoR faimly transcriptional regulator [Bacillus sp. FJAT-27231]